jgi:hypothetical protein
VIVLAAALVVSLSPNPSHFGDLVTARVQGGATPSFVPFSVRGHHGDTYVLQCLDPRCVPNGASKTFLVGGAHLVVLPRTTAGEAAHPLRSFRRQTQVPPPSYRIAPTLLRALLLLGAALLVAAAFAVAWPLARRLVPERRDERTPLERALALVRASLRRPPQDRRRALDLLARVVGRDPQARQVLELAWSRPDPEPARVEALVDAVEHAS